MCLRRRGDMLVAESHPFVDDWKEGEREELLERLSSAAAAGRVVGAYADAKLKGFAMLGDGLFGGDNAYIDLAELHVSRDCRRMGTGTELFARVAGVARCLGARKLYISAHSAVETQEFYKKLGCVPAALPDAVHVAREPFDIQLEYSLY